jgi:hypothetical protein
VKPREFEVEQTLLAAKRASVNLRVFVGGPYIDPKWEEVPTDKKADAAVCARFEIRRHIEDKLGYATSIGEDTSLEALYKEHLDDLFEASTMEVEHVVDACDAVVILPSSAGSFCELGYFAAADSISAKMLIILDAKFSKQRGYIHYGPAKQASLYGSTVIETDYADIGTILGEVSKFLNKIQRKKLSSRFRVPA